MPTRTRPTRTQTNPPKRLPPAPTLLLPPALPPASLLHHLSLTTTSRLALLPLSGNAEFAPFAIGLTLMVFVYAGAHVSGANYNPAVSFALALRGALPWSKMVMYVAVQLMASILAAISGMALLGSAEIGHPAINLTKYTYASALLGEIFYTFALVFVVRKCSVAWRPALSPQPRP